MTPQCRRTCASAAVRCSPATTPMRRPGRSPRPGSRRVPTDQRRYHDLLPVGAPENVVSLGERITPLLPLLPLPRVGAAIGVPGLLVKDESALPDRHLQGAWRGHRGLAGARARHRGGRYARQRQRRGRLGGLRGAGPCPRARVHAGRGAAGRQGRSASSPGPVAARWRYVPGRWGTGSRRRARR